MKKINIFSGFCATADYEGPGISGIER